MLSSQQALLIMAIEGGIEKGNARKIPASDALSSEPGTIAPSRMVALRSIDDNWSISTYTPTNKGRYRACQ